MTRSAPARPGTTATETGLGRTRYVPMAAAQGLTDEPGVQTAIVLQVTAALLAEPPTELTIIEVNSKQGTVTLTGHVGSARLYTMAGEIASKHPGVESTVNDIEIRKRGLPDQEIKV